MNTTSEKANIKNLKKEYRKLIRSRRLIRYYLLFKFPYLYGLRHLNSSLLEHKSSYTEAEEMSDMINTLFGENTKPVDFLHSEDELIDKCLDLTQEMKALETCLSIVGITPEDMYAFCKEIQYGKKSFLFKPYGQMISFILEDLLNYDLGIISKEEAEHKINAVLNFKYSLLGGNTAFVRKVITQIEMIFVEVKSKRLIRNIRKNISS